MFDQVCLRKRYKPTSAMHVIRRNTLLLLAVMLPSLSSGPAAARIGEAYSEFKPKAERGFKLKSETKKDNRTYYMYVMTLDRPTQEAAPGFTGGLTLTVIGGKITGQSMVLRLGDYQEAGKALAAAHALDFAYESLGKASPKSKVTTEKELAAYTTALDQALDGVAQNIRYPGFNVKITMSKYGQADILIAAVADTSSLRSTQVIKHK